VGWVVAPPAVRAAVLDLRDRTGTRPARAGQRVVGALAAHGDLGRHVRRLRRELAGRRRRVIDAVAAAGREVRGDAAGAHVVVPLPGLAEERAVVAAAAVRGVTLDGLERHHAGTAATGPDATQRITVPGVVIGYGGAARDELDRALGVVTEVLRRV
jgi:GntR family transcriptional regulator/MocR family aminotransferase